MGYLGYSIISGDYDGSVSQSVTIPDGATFCLAYLGSDAVLRTFSSITLGGTPMASVVTGSSVTNRVWSCACTSGSVTFAYTASGSFSYGGGGLLLYFDDVDSVRSSTFGALGAIGTFTSSAITTEVDDLVVICAFQDEYTSPGVLDVAINSQTQIVETGDINKRSYGAAYKVAAGASTSLQAYGNWPCACVVSLIPVAAAATLAQHSFRFFNDDGSESAATAKAAINTNINLSANDVARIRFLIDATGDPTGNQFQLEYRKKPSDGSFGDWTKVN